MNFLVRMLDTAAVGGAFGQLMNFLLHPLIVGPLTVVALAGCATRPAPPAALSVKPAPTRPIAGTECGVNLNQPWLKPSPPGSAVRAGQSGWVAVTFDVDAGKIRNVHVADSSPTGVFEAAVLETLEGEVLPQSDGPLRACYGLFTFKLN